MKFKALSCPNCGANYDPTTCQCEYCGSYIFTPNDNYKDLSNIKIELPQKPKDDPSKYPGIYVFGRLLGRGEKPITLGVASYYTGLVCAGGKLLLTNKSLSFSAHAINFGRQEVKIDLKQITNVKVSADLLVSQHILVTANGKAHKFLVYHGSEWVQKIEEAIANCDDPDASPVPTSNAYPYIEELQQLKQLLDMDVITEEEFNIKKRKLLGL